MNDTIKDFKVSDLQSFAELVEMLRSDFINNPSAWENRNIEDFLEAIARYTIDIQGYYDNTHQNINASIPSWQTFADILVGSTIYE